MGRRDAEERRCRLSRGGRAERRPLLRRGGQHRRAPLGRSVLLRELDAFNGIVIFATNLAANFDPAFERRIRTHVLFEMPGAEERERIWKVQIHPRKTPLAGDVDFRALAERFALSGGDIKNAVIKAAAAAASDAGPEVGRRIHQRHFERAVEEVMAAKTVMQQSLFAEPVAPDPYTALQIIEGRWRKSVLVALAMGGGALIASLAALAIVLFR